MMSGGGRLAVSSMLSSPQPEDVEICLVPLHQVFVAEVAEPLSLLTLKRCPA